MPHAIERLAAPYRPHLPRRAVQLHSQLLGDEEPAKVGFMILGFGLGYNSRRLWSPLVTPYATLHPQSHITTHSVVKRKRHSSKKAKRSECMSCPSASNSRSSSTVIPFSGVM
mmetsp:Transcript_45368/g.144342  ORF Transcript_45368/g.144342 Transcript_45368/m.144342 type:complete len:113 (-) Transcript_45368:191-529(-)